MNYWQQKHQVNPSITPTQINRGVIPAKEGIQKQY